MDDYFVSLGVCCSIGVVVVEMKGELDLAGGE